MSHPNMWDICTKQEVTMRFHPDMWRAVDQILLPWWLGETSTNRCHWCNFTCTKCGSFWWQNLSMFCLYVKWLRLLLRIGEPSIMMHCRNTLFNFPRVTSLSTACKQTKLDANQSAVMDSLPPRVTSLSTACKQSKLDAKALVLE